MNEDFSLHNEEIQLLQGLIGTTLQKISTNEAPEVDEFWWPLYLTGDGKTVKIFNDMRAANYFDTMEDCGRLTIAAGESVVPKVYTKNVGQSIQDIELVTNHIHFPPQEATDLAAFNFEYPRALIFKFSDSVLTIERGWRFQEYLVAKLQDKSQVELVDEYPEWFDADDPNDPRPEFRQSIVSVTKL